MKTIDIDKVFTLAKTRKYEIACASFDVVDHIFKVDVAKNLKNRKLAVQAMSVLADGGLKYGYDDNLYQKIEADGSATLAQKPPVAAAKEEE